MNTQIFYIFSLNYLDKRKCFPFSIKIKILCGKGIKKLEGPNIEGMTSQEF